MNEINYKYRLIMIFKKAMIMAVLTGALSLSAHDGEAPHTSPTEPITAEVQTGQGSHTYTTVPGWGKVPGSDYLGSTHGGIVVDQAGSLRFH